MPRHPQCPRCGDTVTALSPTDWRPDLNPADRTDAAKANQWREWCDDIATRGVCDLCNSAILAKLNPPADDTQAKLAAAVAKPTNVYAYPLAVPFDAPGVQHGMTLRDHFAGQAVAGLVDYWSGSDFDHESAAEIAAHAYLIADAMLKARG